MDSAAATRVGAQLEAMLIEPLFEGTFDDSSALGGYGRSLLALEIARSDAHGFGAALARRVQERP